MLGAKMNALMKVIPSFMSIEFEIYEGFFTNCVLI